METIKKFVIIGPESTGKSTLCKQLAAYYNTLWVPEYAREYLKKNGKEYNYENLLTIAKGQIELEESIGYQVSAIRNQQSVPGNEGTPDPSYLIPHILFVDTDMYVMKVWCEYVFNKCHSWILNRIAERYYDGYLLCNSDLPWVRDNLREYPDVSTRNKLYHFYKDILVNQSVAWKEISGNYTERFENARKFIGEAIKE